MKIFVKKQKIFESFKINFFVISFLKLFIKLFIKIVNHLLNYNNKWFLAIRIFKIKLIMKWSNKIKKFILLYIYNLYYIKYYLISWINYYKNLINLIELNKKIKSV